MATELVASGVDVLVTIGANAPAYAKEATKTIPIVFALMPDPIESKLVSNLAHPEASVTGLSNSASDIMGSGWSSSNRLFQDFPALRFSSIRTLRLRPVIKKCLSRRPLTLGFQERLSHGVGLMNELRYSPLPICTAYARW
jgi:ABC transporter substrate binding protein